MSILSKEILGYLSPVLKGNQGELMVSITFPSEFSGFKGHFPGRPIVPGVCMVQAVLVSLGKDVRLKQLVSAKWLVPVSSGEKLDIVMRPKMGEASMTRVKVSVTRPGSGLLKGEVHPSRAAEERIAEFVMEVTGMTQGASNS